MSFDFYGMALTFHICINIISTVNTDTTAGKEQSMKFIDYQDGRPIYEQIAESYKTLILKGVLEPDEQMPSVRKLAMELSTNPNTVQRAYAELERQGFLYSVKGKGNFVKGGPDLKEKKKMELLEKLEDLFREAEEVGIGRQELLQAASGKEKAEHAEHSSGGAASQEKTEESDKMKNGRDAS